MNALISRIQANPNGFAEIIRTTLLASVTLGLHLSPEQIIAVMVPVSLILSFFSHAASTATSAPELPVGTAVNKGSAVVASVDPPPPPTADVAGART